MSSNLFYYSMRYILYDSFFVRKSRKQNIYITDGGRNISHTGSDIVAFVTRTKSFPGSAPISEFSGIRCMYGDTHNHGKSIACVCLNEMPELIYKPRSLENELHFQKLLKKISLECALWDEKIGIKIISRPDFGWEEKICFQECTLEEVVKRFYQRTGILICLA